MPVIEVSSQGRVRACARVAPMPYGGTRIYGGVGSFGQWDGSRYLYVLRRRTYKVARLVCEAFSGPPQPGQVCMHLDEDARNNRPENLRWGTQRENLNAPKYLAYRQALNAKLKAQREQRAA
ncbi:MAG: HNH endonuclease signature motif containing protein [Pseudomonadota bacterium]